MKTVIKSSENNNVTPNRIRKSKKSCENNENINTKLIKSPKKSFENLMRIKPIESYFNKNVKNEVKNEENTSDDEIVLNSQENCKSILKKNKNRNELRKSTSSLSVVQKNIHCNVPKKKTNASDIAEADMFNVKNEYDYVCDDSIEITHDISEFTINNDLSSTTSECSQLPSNGDNNSTIEENEDIRKVFKNGTKDPHVKKKKNSRPIRTLRKKKVSNHDDVCKLNDVKLNDKEHHLLYEISDETKKKLKSLKIKLQHNVPPQHKIERRAGTVRLTKAQEIEFEMYVPLKKGFFTREEDKIIDRNWKKFCEIHDWDKKDYKPFLYFRHAGKYYINLEERINFVRFLANGLPCRSLQQTYYRFRKFINPAHSGLYNYKEDRLIIKHLTNSVDNRCGYVAKILNRDLKSVWARYKTLKTRGYIKNDKTIINDIKMSKSKNSNSAEKKRKQKNTSKTNVDLKVTWTYPLVTEFIDVLLKNSNCKLEELKHKIIDQSVWKTVEKSLNINQTILKNFWYTQLHMQIFCPMPIYLNDLKIQLIEYLYELEVEALEDTIWESICLKFEGITSIFLSKLFKSLLKQAEKKISCSKLKDIVQYLHDKLVPEIEEKSRDIILPKLYLKNNKIIRADKGTETKIPDKHTTNPFSDDDI